VKYSKRNESIFKEGLIQDKPSVIISFNDINGDHQVEIILV
jgi:hypothetical protein